MPGGPKQAISNIPKTFGETILKPVGDQLAEAVEQGVSDTFGISVKSPKPFTPKPVQRDPLKKAEEDRRRQNILRYFDTLKTNAQTYKQQEEAALQKKRQDQIVEKQKIQQFQFVEQKKKQSTDVFRAQRKAEIKVKGG